MIERFTGTCEAFASINISKLAAWIVAISFEDWPQQHRLADGKLRPAMVSDPEWNGFGQETAGIVAELLALFPGHRAYQRMLSVVMGGHSIEPHVDHQAPEWRCRVHVPLLANSRSAFIVGGRAYALAPGTAYRVNTEAEHAVTNDGDSPRIHFMFDVGAP